MATPSTSAMTTCRPVSRLGVMAKIVRRCLLASQSPRLTTTSTRLCQPACIEESARNKRDRRCRDAKVSRRMRRWTRFGLCRGRSIRSQAEAQDPSDPVAKEVRARGETLSRIWANRVLCPPLHALEPRAALCLPVAPTERPRHASANAPTSRRPDQRRESTPPPIGRGVDPQPLSNRAVSGDSGERQGVD